MKIRYPSCSVSFVKISDGVDDNRSSAYKFNVSWRFRKSFKVLPGVRLNLTSRGLSATVGVAPLSLNIGPRGVYANTSIPGPGIGDRQRFDVPSATSNNSDTSRFDEPQISKKSEIQSANTELLTSEDLEPLRKLLRE